MSAEAKITYMFCLSEADDRGFVDDIDLMERVYMIDLKAIKELVDNQFLIELKHNEETIYLITDWWQHNNKNKTNRFKESKYVIELKNVYYDENNSYTYERTEKPVLNNRYIV